MSDGHLPQASKNPYEPKEITSFERKPGVCNLNTPQPSNNPKVMANRNIGLYYKLPESRKLPICLVATSHRLGKNPYKRKEITSFA